MRLHALDFITNFHSITILLNTDKRELLFPCKNSMTLKKSDRIDGGRVLAHSTQLEPEQTSKKGEERGKTEARKIYLKLLSAYLPWQLQAYLQCTKLQSILGFGELCSGAANATDIDRGSSCATLISRGNTGQGGIKRRGTG